LIAQRIYALALGYEDLNGHDELRNDPLPALLVGKKDPTGKDRIRKRDKGKALAGKSTLNRLELTPIRADKHSRYKKITVNKHQVDAFKSWSRSRRVVGKAEYLQKGENPRFVVTSLSIEQFDGQTLYQEQYCARGRIICDFSVDIAEKWYTKKDNAVSSCACREKTSQNHRL